MGVDISINVKFLNKKNEEKYEVNISDQDNTLDSLLQGPTDNGQGLRYVNFGRDRNTLTDKENEYIKIDHHPEHEEMMQTDILDATKAYEIFEKIYSSLEIKKAKALSEEVKKFQNEADENRRINKIREYFHFENSISTLLGILKTAAAINYKVQIVEYYY
jgi:hypothetical protein